MIRENNTLEWQEIAEQKRMTQRRIIQRRERARRRKRKVWRIRGLLLLFGCLLFLGGVRNAILKTLFSSLFSMSITLAPVFLCLRSHPFE